MSLSPREKIAKEEEVNAKLDRAFGPVPTVGELPFPPSGITRFDFQRLSVSQTKGAVVHCGVNEDPAGIQELFGPRVINCDLHAYDFGMDRPNRVDRLFDITKPEEWEREFAADSAELVLFGDVLEHLPYEEIVNALTYARRVAPKVALTVPEDHRVDPNASYADGEYNLHITICSEHLLRRALADARWTPYLVAQMDWQCSDPNDPSVSTMFGWGIEAHRS